MNKSQQSRLVEKCLESKSALFSQEARVGEDLTKKCYLKQDQLNPCKYYSCLNGLETCSYESPGEKQ